MQYINITEEVLTAHELEEIERINQEVRVEMQDPEVRAQLEAEVQALLARL